MIATLNFLIKKNVRITARKSVSEMVVVEFENFASMYLTNDQAKALYDALATLVDPCYMQEDEPGTIISI